MRPDPEKGATKVDRVSSLVQPNPSRALRLIGRARASALSLGGQLTVAIMVTSGVALLLACVALFAFGLPSLAKLRVCAVEDECAHFLPALGAAAPRVESRANASVLALVEPEA